MNLMRKILLALVTVGFLPVIHSQEVINFTSLTIKDGLSSNTVTSILKDRYGFMWFGTEDGLNKFDGTNFKVYRYTPNDTSSLQTNEILSLHEDPAGNLWVATSGGSLSLYDRKKDAFINFPAGEMEGVIPNSVIMDVCSDFLGRIWVAHYDGVNIVDAITRRASGIPLNNNQRLAIKAPANCLYQDSQHMMWIGTAAGLFRYNPFNKSLERFLHANQDSLSLSGNDARTVAEDREGNIWIGTDGGLSMLKKGTNQFVNYLTEKDNPTGSPGKTVFSIAIDGDKLWAATRKNLDILDIKSGVIQKHCPDERRAHSLTSRSIRRIYIDNKGIYWIGTNGGGVNKYDKNLNLFNFIKGDVFDQKGLDIPFATSFEEDANGNIFVGTDGGGGLSMFNRKNRAFRHFDIRTARKTPDKNIVVLALTKNTKGELILGTFEDGLFVLDPGSGNYRQKMLGQGIGDINSNYICCLKYDQKGNLWVGTNGEGLNVMSPDYKVITRYTPNPKLPNDKLLPFNGYIRDIVEDRRGNIWIATHGGGMGVLDPLTGKFTIFHTRNSLLPNDKVLTLHLDHNGNIWAGTFSNGAAMLDPATNKFTCYSEGNGLQNNTVYKMKTKTALSG